MKCSECDGVGYKKISATSCAICEKCGGTGVVEPLTNEEYIHSLNTEQFAEWLGDVVDEVCDTNNYNCKNCFKWCNRNKVVEWLKQPHREVGK